MDSTRHRTMASKGYSSTTAPVPMPVNTRSGMMQGCEVADICMQMRKRIRHHWIAEE